MSRVLVVDDEAAVCWSVKELLADRGHAVEAVGSVEEAWDRLSSFAPDVVVLDVRLPGMDGLSALPEFRRRCPAAPVIVMTAFGDLPTAVTALGRGAYDYLVKPFEWPRFLELLERALGGSAATEAPVMPVNADGLVGRSAAMQTVFRQIALVAPTPYPVLIVGETGTGKDVAARALHQHGPQPGAPFVPVCPAALNPAVIESELFGHVRGAFTGAETDRRGLFEQAEHGTIFLDEIADTPPAVQVKLLRVLETRRFCPVGSGVERQTHARFIAATHRHLPDMIRAGTFREDLYHRLKVFTIAMPSLRDRRDDIRPLVESFLGGLAEPLRPSGVRPEFWQALERRDWPGNVRELRHAIDHAVVLARGGVLVPDHLPPPEASPTAETSHPEHELADRVGVWVRRQLTAAEPPGDLHRRLLEVIESRLFAEVLAATDQNRTAAAKLLGVDRATLRSRLKSPMEDGDPRD